MQIRRELLDVQRVLGQSFRKAAPCEITLLSATTVTEGGRLTDGP